MQSSSANQKASMKGKGRKQRGDDWGNDTQAHQGKDKRRYRKSRQDKHNPEVA